MNRLPMKPLPLAVIHCGLSLGALLPAAWEHPATRPLAAAAVAGAMALHAGWMWQASAYVVEGLPPGDPAHRRQQFITWLLVAFVAVLSTALAVSTVAGLQADTPLRGLPRGLSFRSLIGPVVMSAFFAAIFLVAETICQAERRQSRVGTLILLFYLPFTSALLYGRLEALRRR